MQKHELRPPPTSLVATHVPSETSGHFSGLLGWFLDVARSRPRLATLGTTYSACFARKVERVSPEAETGMVISPSPVFKAI